MNSNRQHKAALQDESIHNERNKQYLGTARIDLSCLQAFIEDDFRPNQPRDDRSEKMRVKRLVRIFAFEGCLRLEPEHHVDALISQSELNEALKLSSKTPDDLRSKGIPPKLDFRPSKQLKCLNGRHRLKAAKKVLEKGDDWWVVDLYSNGLQSVRNVYCIVY
jgi:hypothetical protein